MIIVQLPSGAGIWGSARKNGRPLTRERLWSEKACKAVIRGYDRNRARGISSVRDSPRLGDCSRRICLLKVDIKINKLKQMKKTEIS